MNGKRHSKLPTGPLQKLHRRDFDAFGLRKEPSR